MDWEMYDDSTLNVFSRVFQENTNPSKKLKTDAPQYKLESESDGALENKKSRSNSNERRTQRQRNPSSTCNKLLRSQTALNLHETTHLEIKKPFSCRICEKPFFQKGHSLS